MLSAEGGYAMPLARQYANGSLYTGSDDISAVYTARQFEYETARQFHLGAMADWSLPIGQPQKHLTAGLAARYQYRRYADSDFCWQGYGGTSAHTLRLSCYLCF